MTVLTIGILLTSLLLILVVMGMRVAYATASIGFLGLICIFTLKVGFIKGVWIAIQMAGTIPHSKASTYALSVIPTFILIGYLAFHAGLTTRLFEASKRWLGWLPGGMGISTIFATAGFSAVSGASLATTAVFSRIAIPELLKIGYSKSLSAGVVAAGGTLATLIPPSTMLVIYAVIVEQSVGKLLLAGFLPGMFSAFIYMSLLFFIGLKNPDKAPRITGYSWLQRWQSTPYVFPILVVIFSIFGGIYFGIASPTEAGAFGALVIMVYAYKNNIKWADFKNILMETSRLTVMIMTMIWGILIFVRFLGFSGVPEALQIWITGLDYPPMVILLCILLIYAVLGMFMDAIGMLLLTLPIVYPTVIALGFDPIWFGIIVVKMVELCLITPPIGLNCFVVSTVRRDIPVQTVFKGCFPFFIMDVLTIALLIAFPSIVTFLPNAMGK